MGAQGSKEVVYAVPVSEPKQGETAIYRFPPNKDKLTVCPSTGARTMQEILL